VVDELSPWPSKDEHSRKYKELASRFVENMKKFADQTPEEVIRLSVAP
jgi:ATP-dependent phosphoenolpyruvate carboxykinase